LQQGPSACLPEDAHKRGPAPLCLQHPAPPARTWPPVSVAMSCRLFLRFSPKPGALTAHTLSPARSYICV